MPTKQCEVCGTTFWQGVGRPSKRCSAHRRDNTRYGGNHQQRRAAGKPYAWGTPCTRCGYPLIEGQDIHLDHIDGGGPDDYAGWAHSACNTSAGGRRGNQLRFAVEPVTYTVPAALPDYPHDSDCRCRAAFAQFGVWPMRCW